VTELDARPPDFALLLHRICPVVNYMPFVIVAESKCHAHQCRTTDPSINEYTGRVTCEPSPFTSPGWRNG
jgi:hypothetical protein